VVGYKEAYLRKFATPVVDLPVKMQLKIYEHSLLTKLIFSSPELTRILQKIVTYYRNLMRGHLGSTLS
jgi:hypothetical protein